MRPSVRPAWSGSLREPVCLSRLVHAHIRGGNILHKDHTSPLPLYYIYPSTVKNVPVCIMHDGGSSCERVCLNR